jgi:essential nuclear protein 1
VFNRMAKKRSRHQNPQPFLADDDASVASKKRSKAPKQHQAEEKLISSGMSSKILKEALAQQREIQDEVEGRNPNDNDSVFAQGFTEAEEAHDDIDEFAGFAETQSQFGAYDVSGIVLLLVYTAWLLIICGKKESGNFGLWILSFYRVRREEQLG